MGTTGAAVVHGQGRAFTINVNCDGHPHTFGQDLVDAVKSAKYHLKDALFQLDGYYPDLGEWGAGSGEYDYVLDLDQKTMTITRYAATIYDGSIESFDGQQLRASLENK